MNYHWIRVLGCRSNHSPHFPNCFASNQEQTSNCIDRLMAEHWQAVTAAKQTGDVSPWCLHSSAYLNAHDHFHGHLEPNYLSFPHQPKTDHSHEFQGRLSMVIRSVNLLFKQYSYYRITFNKTLTTKVCFVRTMSSRNLNQHAEWREAGLLSLHYSSRGEDFSYDFLFLAIRLSQSHIHPSARTVFGFPSLTAPSVYSASLETKEGFPPHQQALGPPCTPTQTLNPAMQTLRRAACLSLSVELNRSMQRHPIAPPHPRLLHSFGGEGLQPGFEPETEPSVIPSCSYTQLLLGGVCNCSASLQLLPQSWSTFFFVLVAINLQTGHTSACADIAAEARQEYDGFCSSVTKWETLQLSSAPPVTWANLEHLQVSGL